MECTIKIGGEAGQGLQSIETQLVHALSAFHYHFFGMKNYMSRIRGGHNFHMIRIADEPVQALSGRGFEVIVAMDAETEARHKKTLAKNGVYISKAQTDEISAYAKTNCGEAKAANTIITGLLLAVIGCDEAALDKLQLGAPAKNCLLKGFEFAKRWKVAGTFPVTPSSKPYHVFTGNQALGLGAIMGGCRFMAGYPMTPATGVMNYLAHAAETLPVVFEQAEDEISAINMAIGASYAGVRAMVATSGGGFALMQEGISLIGMTETPLVIIVAQRPAPATGLPTRTEQADLNFVLHAGHGEFPRIIFAPGSIEEALFLAAKSFELADTYQIPVFILTDQYLADAIYDVPAEVLPEQNDRHYATYTKDYARYRLTKTGISPLTYPGISDALVQVDSDEHDEAGKITEDLDLRSVMVDKRLNKFKTIYKETVSPTFYGKKTATTVLVSWGSNKKIVEEAVDILVKEKYPVCALHFSQVYPLAETMVKKHALSNKKNIISIENNATGQFARLLRSELDVRVSDTILKYNGEPFVVKEIVNTVKKKLLA